MRISDWSSDVCSSDLALCLLLLCAAAFCLPRSLRKRAAAPSRFCCGLRSTARASAGTSSVMVLPAATIAPSPTLTGATSAVLLPMKAPAPMLRSEEHTSELQSLMRTSYAVFRLTHKQQRPQHTLQHPTK